MASSRVLTQQWRGTSAGFGRSQTMLGEDSAAEDGRFQNLSKKPPGVCSEAWAPESLRSHVRGPQRPLPDFHSGPYGARTRPGFLNSLRPEIGMKISLLGEPPGARGQPTPSPTMYPHHSPPLPFQGPPVPMAVPCLKPLSPPKHQRPGNLINREKAKKQFHLFGSQCFFQDSQNLPLHLHLISLCLHLGSLKTHALTIW